MAYQPEAQTHLRAHEFGGGVAVIIGAGGCALGRPWEPGERAHPSALGRTVLLGTWTWDVESDSQGNNSQVDIWWEQETGTARYLTPKNGAQLALLRGADYDSIGLKELQRARYSGERLSGSDSEGVLRPGTVVAMKTAEGNYAKLKVLGYRSNHDVSFKEAAIKGDAWKSRVLSRPERPNYHLEVAWSLYSQRPK